jgi:dTDP-4-dehydrorhamnose 3,5-epimerase
MISETVNIPDVLLITTDRFNDHRGFFDCVWDNKSVIVPSNINFSYNIHKNTLRGMHFQREPHGQKKLVTCVSGKIFDVIVDLRKSSSMYKKWFGVELDSKEEISLLIPNGCAHGFLTLEENSIVSYIIEGEYIPEAAMSLLWDDPIIGIQWPIKELPIMSEKDKKSLSFDCL